MQLMCTGAAERPEATALGFHSKAVFSEKLGVTAGTSLFIISVLLFCGLQVDKIMLTQIR